MQCFMGADPGASGGIAVIDAEGKYVDFIKFKQHPRDLITKLYAVRDFITLCIVEQVHGWKGDGVSNTFAFGGNAASMIFAIRATGIEPDDEKNIGRPQTWQKYMGCQIGGQNKTDKKNTLKARCEEIFKPRNIPIKITLTNADAFLLAEYARRVALERKII